jgi:hypothetical protein
LLSTDKGILEHVLLHHFWPPEVPGEASTDIESAWFSEYIVQSKFGDLLQLYLKSKVLVFKADTKPLLVPRGTGTSAFFPVGIELGII